MPGHTRLYRRGATYYHRAAVPKDIVDSYGKREETFSLRTKDNAEALKLVRIAAVEVDQRFEQHRLEMEQGKQRNAQPPLTELSADQIAGVKKAYFHHILDEDEEVRLDSFHDPDDLHTELPWEPRPIFEERQQLNEGMDEITRVNLARGKQDEFFRSEAEEVLTWDGIELRLAESSTSWLRLVRVLQEASVEAHEAIRDRERGDSVPTPDYPFDAPTAHTSGAPLLSEAVKIWEEEKTRVAWSIKTRNDHMTWMASFTEVAGDRPITEYRKGDARSFKSVLLKLPADWRKRRGIRHLSLVDAAQNASESGLKPMSVTTLNKALTRVGSFWSWCEAHYDGIAPSLFKGQSIDAKVAVRDQRHPFSIDLTV